MRIYEAGPGFMFVPARIETGEQAVITLYLDKSIEYVGLVLSVLTLSLLLGDYLSRGRLHEIPEGILRKLLLSLHRRWYED